VLTSPAFNLTGAFTAQVQFQTWWEIESVNPEGYDVLQVEYSTDGGNTWVLASRLNPVNGAGGNPDQSYTINGVEQPAQWYPTGIDLSGAAGKSSVQIRFNFDTRDTLYNGFRGWFVDNVQVMINSKNNLGGQGNLNGFLLTDIPQSNVKVYSAGPADIFGLVKLVEPIDTLDVRKLTCIR